MCFCRPNLQSMYDKYREIRSKDDPLAAKFENVLDWYEAIAPHHKGEFIVWPKDKKKPEGFATNLVFDGQVLYTLVSLGLRAGDAVVDQKDVSS